MLSVRDAKNQRPAYKWPYATIRCVYSNVCFTIASGRSISPLWIAAICLPPLPPRLPSRPRNRNTTEIRPDAASEISASPMQCTELRGLFQLMVLHPAHHAVQHVQRMEDKRPLVEHHAFGAFRHRGIGDLGARRDVLLDHAFEHLRRPDHRRIRGFA